MQEIATKTSDLRNSTKNDTSLQKKNIYVFSPDEDLAKVLILNLESKFNISREFKLSNFEERIKNNKPNLILADFYSFSDGIQKQIDILRKCVRDIPVIALRNYTPLSSDINRRIEELADVTFYKPLDVELVSQAIEDLLK